MTVFHDSPAADPRTPAREADDAHRRVFRSVASLIEIARQVQSGQAAGRVRRQILMAAMGVADAEAGAVFRAEAGGRARLIEVIGGRDGLAPGLILPLGECAAQLVHEAPFLVLPEQADGDPWNVLAARFDPGFAPRIVVPLAGVRRPNGFLLLGRLPGSPDAAPDRSRCAILAGLIGIITTARVATAAAKLVARAPGMRAMAPAPSHRSSTLDELRAQEPALMRFLGGGPATERIFYDVIGVAGTNIPVLFEGESGTGKEQLARIIHEIARGPDAPFEAVNCGAIPEALIESELFGHVQGAFTGATRGHRGVFERADGGTVFLDEIGDMPPPAQVKLLRVLQEGTFSPVGGEELRRCSCRIIAATHRDLRREVDARRFRQDLFYRLSVFPIRIPPLRERREDVPALVRAFLAQSAAENGRRPLEVDDDAMRRLSIYSFPGNVRELQNIVRTLLVEARGSRISDDHVAAVFSRHRVGEPASCDGHPPAAPGEARPVEEAGVWVLDQLRRYYFNLALAERMLEERRRSSGDRRSVPVFSRSGLTYYFQGECLRALEREGWDRHAAAARVAGGERMTLRVRRALDHLLDGALEALRGGGESPQSRLAALQARFVKLPEPYHPQVRLLAERFEAGRWP